jgi:hypothetical protein
VARGVTAASEEQTNDPEELESGYTGGSSAAAKSLFAALNSGRAPGRGNARSSLALRYQEVDDTGKAVEQAFPSQARTGLP